MYIGHIKYSIQEGLNIKQFENLPKKFSFKILNLYKFINIPLTHV